MKVLGIIIIIFILAGCSNHYITDDITDDITITSTPHVFPEIFFSTSDSNTTGFITQQEKIGNKCRIIKEKDTENGVQSSCENISGYIHTYHVSDLHLSISQDQRPYLFNDNLFTSTPEIPFVVSGSTIYLKEYHNTSDYIEYISNKEQIPVDGLISEITKNLSGGSLQLSQNYNQLLSKDIKEYTVFDNNGNISDNPVMYYFSTENPHFYYKVSCSSEGSPYTFCSWGFNLFK